MIQLGFRKFKLNSYNLKGLYCNNALTGVLSFGQSCGAANLPGVYMDVRQYSDWIVQQFTRTDNPQAGL